MDWTSCLDKDSGIPTIQCIPIVFINIINAALLFSGVTALVFIIISGLTLMNSAGDPKKVASAKGTLTYAIIGVILVLLAFAIVNIIGNLTGVSCIAAFGFSNCQ
jgi:hypothetical protein